MPTTLLDGSTFFSNYAYDSPLLFNTTDDTNKGCNDYGRMDFDCKIWKAIHWEQDRNENRIIKHSSFRNCCQNWFIPLPSPIFPSDIVRKPSLRFMDSGEALSETKSLLQQWVVYVISHRPVRLKKPTDSMFSRECHWNGDCIIKLVRRLPVGPVFFHHEKRKEKEPNSQQPFVSKFLSKRAYIFLHE